MAASGNYIQVVIRGLYNSQQWQISPTYTCLDIDSVAPPYGDFTFLPGELSARFVNFWNGWGALPTNGLSDMFLDQLPETASITEVRCIAKTNTMAVPEQAIIVGTLEGTRGTTDQALPSFQSISCFARSATWGQKGASMRLPMLLETDITANNILETRRGEIQTLILDPISSKWQEVVDEFGFTILTAGDEVLNVGRIVPAVVQRVNSPTTGKPTFPYEGFANISAFECEPWSLNPWVSTQNSRKVGRGK